MRVGEAVRQARQALASVSSSAAGDARLLVADSVGESTTWVLAHDGEALAPAAVRRFRVGLDRCRDGEPLPYVLGRWEFWGRSFLVEPGVLIPRPETEGLVEAAIDAVAGEAARIVDVGTGSGCIAVSLALAIPNAAVLATDISPIALRVARRNAVRHGVERRIRFVRSDLLAAVAGPWDLVCANLPYLPSPRFERPVPARREPRLALDGGSDGLSLISALIADLPRVLAPNGVALIEIDEGQAPALTAHARRILSGASAEMRRDLAGQERLLILRRPAR